MFQPVSEPQNPEILGLVKDGIVDDTAWEEFEQRAQTYTRTHIECLPLGDVAEDSEHTARWIAEEDRRYEPNVGQFAGKEYGFMRFLKIFKKDAISGDPLVMYTLSLRTGRIDAEILNEAGLDGPNKTPRDGFLRGVELIFGKTIEPLPEQDD